MSLSWRTVVAKETMSAMVKLAGVIEMSSVTAWCPTQ